ncbi:hypothetical protein V6N12_002601 [Hibiscus sabdariffa]|uniref:SWIM-type domain-containing protein n=1 Tax=Hibiscus sabdariffa TaxID=183260 RepID=A0ABR2E9F9_9ROSI
MSRSDTVFRVAEIPRPLQGYDPTSYHVNLEEKWCDCGYFQALKSPCHCSMQQCQTRLQEFSGSCILPSFSMQGLRDGIPSNWQQN